MKAYTCQIGNEIDGKMAKPTYSEQLFAYSLIEAIDRAKAIVNTRPVHENENTVRLMDGDDQTTIEWTRLTEEVRNPSSAGV